MGHVHLVESAHVGCKVLPICDSETARSSCSGDGDGPEMKEAMTGGRKVRAVSRMKELWRWAAAGAKSPKGNRGWKATPFRNRSPLRPPMEDGGMSTSPCKISFKWDVGSCSGSSSVYSLPFVASSRNGRAQTNRVSGPLLAMQVASSGGTKEEEECAARAAAHWVTTDSDFVVLEL